MSMPSPPSGRYQFRRTSSHRNLLAKPLKQSVSSRYLVNSGLVMCPRIEMCVSVAWASGRPSP